MSINRRDVIRKAGLAGSLVTIPVVAGTIANRAEAAVCSAPTDPALTAVAAYREARGAMWAFDGASKHWTGTAEAFDAALDAALDEAGRAAVVMLATPPTSVAGLLALVEAIQETQSYEPELCGLSEWCPQVHVEDWDGPDNAEEMLLQTLLKSLRGLVGQSRCGS